MIDVALALVGREGAETDGEGIISLAPGIEATKTSLTIPEGTSFEEWEAVGGKLRQVYGAAQWWVGDWLNFGERKYGEISSQALEVGAVAQTWRTCKWVASRFELSRRHDNLTFSHHREVAALDPDEADALLLQAEVSNWTILELREKLKQVRLLVASGTIDEPIKIVAAGQKKERPPRFLTPHQQTKKIALGMICGAIDEHDREWLLSDDCRDYFAEFDLPYDPIEIWVKGGFSTMEESLKMMLKGRAEGI